MGAVIDLDRLAYGNFLWSRVDVRRADECWPWRLSTGSHGYGQTWDGTTVTLAHRAAYALTRYLHPSMTVDHICRNRVCCNPSHLRLMPNVENASSNGNAIKTQCKRGHPFDAVNTMTDHRGHRRCRACEAVHRANLNARRAVA